MSQGHIKFWRSATHALTGVSVELDSLISRVCKEIDSQSADCAQLTKALEALLAFLASPKGLTDPNCRAVDRFFCIPNEFGWQTSWEHLPNALRDIIDDMGSTLHDSVSSPKIAEDFDSTPELLLVRLKKLDL